MSSSGHNYHHLKIMHVSVIRNILGFPTNRHTLGHPVCDLHLKLDATAITAAYFVEIKEKHQNVLGAKGKVHCIVTYGNQ